MAAGSTDIVPATTPRRRLPAGERRQQILSVAQDAFMRAGYRGTTALEIGRAAGVSEKLVLKHFGSKEGLFRAAVVEPMLELMMRANEDARLRMAGGTEDDSPEQAFQRVHRFLATWAALVREQAPLIFAFIAEMREFPEVAAQLGALFEQQVRETTDILSLAMRTEAFRPFDPRVAFLSALGAATMAALTGDDVDHFLDEYLRLTLFGALSDAGRADAAADEPASRPASVTRRGGTMARTGGGRRAD
jgi:AcrR family transcriptional regulator